MTDRRSAQTVSGGAWVAATLVVLISFLSAFSVGDPDQVVATGPAAGGGPADVGPVGPEDEATGDDGERQTVRRQVVTGGQAGTGGTEGTAGGPGGPQGTGPGGAATGDYDCSANPPVNAGESDIGVSGNEIRLAASVVRTGIAKDFLGEAQLGIEAVVRKANAQGSICGRRLTVTFDDDAWDPAAGGRIIRKWIGEENHFALVVNPSSEGLRGAIRAGLIDESEFPVVGADGMLIGQYTQEWVWPVATSTHSVMHVMARHAYEKLGAKTFAIVWEGNFRFGVEGFNAFKGTVERLRKNDSKVKLVDVEIQGGQQSYRNEVNRFMGDCGNDFADCDFVAVLLEPATASQWVKDGGLGTKKPGEPMPRPSAGLGAPQPLFVDSFIRSCGEPCSGLWVWTSFKPPLHPFDSDAAVVEYVRDMRAVSGSVDVNNPHVQGAYVGTRLLVEALKQLGPDPTRQGMKQVLDQISFDSGLAPPFRFRPGDKFAAVSAQAFEAIFNVGSFANWQYTGTGFIEDKEVQLDQKEDR